MRDERDIAVVANPRVTSRALGVLMLWGGALALLGTALARPEQANAGGVAAVAGVSVLVGGATLLWAPHARVWTAHCVFALGTGLICLGAYFGGAATGMYAVMLVWLVIVAASFFSARAVVAHVVWILAASGLMLATVDGVSDASAATRWVFGGLLLAIAATMMSRIARSRRAAEEHLRAEIRERERLQRELEHLADHDPLTGLANRRRLEQELDRELERARRDGTPLCVVALDLDKFKEHNDAHGHAAGDRLLRHAASIWAQALRATDLLARTGGDEFVALLPDCPPAMAERLRDRFSADVAPACTPSAGIACWDGTESADELLARADRAMYAAKPRPRAARERSPAEPL